jgi:hypothetical protein
MKWLVISTALSGLVLFTFCFKLRGEGGFRPLHFWPCSLVRNKVPDEKHDGM